MGQIILLFTSILRMYETLMLIYILMSWIPESRNTQLGRTIGALVEPYLAIFRKIIPPIGMISLAGLVALLSLQLVEVGVATIFNFIIRLIA